MKHPIKAGLLLMVLLHLFIGGAAIHTAIAWFGGGGDAGGTVVAEHQGAGAIKVATPAEDEAEPSSAK